MRGVYGIALLLGLFACKAGELRTQSRPVVVGTDTVATVTTVMAGKKSTITVQVGAGNHATATDNTKAGQRSGAAATAPSSSARAATQKHSVVSAVLPWVCGAGVLYSLLPLPLTGAGWLWAVLRRRKREPETG